MSLSEEDLRFARLMGCKLCISSTRIDPTEDCRICTEDGGKNNSIRRVTAEGIRFYFMQPRRRTFGVVSR